MELILYSTGFIFFLLSVVATVVLYSQKRIVQAELSKKQLKIDFQQQLVGQIIQTQEEERSRIAREIHDAVNGKLSIVHLHISSLGKRVPGDEIHRLSNVIQNVIENARRISHDLIPPTLENFGFIPAVEEHFELLLKQPDLSVELDLDAEFNTFGKDLQLQLFRIVQELVQNTLKHSEATNITLEGRTVGLSTFELNYTDNGKGMEPGSEDVQREMGMKNLKIRAEMIGAEMNTFSSPGNGVNVKLKF